MLYVGGTSPRIPCEETCMLYVDFPWPVCCMWVRLPLTLYVRRPVCCMWVGLPLASHVRRPVCCMWTSPGRYVECG